MIGHLNEVNKIFDAFEVSKRQCNTTLAVIFSDFEEFISIQPAFGSCYVSASEPFSKEMEIDYERLVNGLAIMACRSITSTFLGK